MESGDRARRGSPTPVERWVLGLAIAAAVALRVAWVGAPLDRGFDGFQGAFFTVCAINYERLADARAGGGEGLLPDGAGFGYPVVNLELDVDDPDGWYLYANHPPTVAWLAWAGLRALGPADWDRAWREHRAPADFEGALRAPFLALHLAGLGALFAALSAAGCRRAAWYGTALYACAPATLLFAGLVNYENPSVPFALAGAAATMRYLRTGRAAWLAAVAGTFACAGAVTYAPVFTAGALAVAALAVAPRRAPAVAGAAIGGTLLPLLVHGAAAGALLAEHGESVDSLTGRVRTMLAPLLDGETPLGAWLGVQRRLALDEVGALPLALAAAGAACAVARLARRADPPAGADRSATLALALAVGGAAVQLAFYRHTRDPQDPFVLHLVPGLAALGGVALARVSTLRAGAALALALFAATLLESGLRTLELHLRWRGDAAQQDELLPHGPHLPPPHVLGPPLAELVPPGDVAWYPAALGLNPATGLYAWRTLLPMAPEAYSATQQHQNELGLEEATTWLLVPRHLPGPARPSVTRILADLEQARPGALAEPSAENATWRAWRLRN